MSRKLLEVDAETRRLAVRVPEDSLVVEYRDGRAAGDGPARVRQALAQPLGLPPLARSLRPGLRMTVAFDDSCVCPSPVLLEKLAGGDVRPDELTLMTSTSAVSRRPGRGGSPMAYVHEAGRQLAPGRDLAAVRISGDRFALRLRACPGGALETPPGVPPVS